MKKSRIRWFVLLGLFCTFVIELGVGFASLPLRFTPRWPTIALGVVSVLAFAAAVIRKEWKASEVRKPEANQNPEPAVALAGAAN